MPKDLGYMLYRLKSRCPARHGKPPPFGARGRARLRRRKNSSRRAWTGEMDTNYGFNYTALHPQLVTGPTQLKVELCERRLNGNRARNRGLLVLQVGVGSAVSAPLARQIENAVDCPDRIEGAGVA